MAQDVNSEQIAPKRHQSLGARLLVAFGFSTVGAKLGILGSIADVKSLSGSEMSWSQAAKGVFKKSTNNESFIGKLIDRMEHLANEGKSAPMAMVSVMKYSLITGGIAGAAGLVVGWLRGGLIENWKDVFKHPIRSTKIVLGLEKVPEPKQENAAIVETSTLQPTEPKEKWTSKVYPRTSHIEAVDHEKATQSVASIG